MPNQRLLFCKTCYRDQIFEYVYKSHGFFGGGHEDWHCTVCHNCSYEPARKR